VHRALGVFHGEVTEQLQAMPLGERHQLRDVGRRESELSGRV
jgi:hypothetical protein